MSNPRKLNWKDKQRAMALECFRLVNGPGDSGSEQEFNCRLGTEQSGWMRLAARMIEPDAPSIVPGKTGPEYSTLAMVERAVRNARPRGSSALPRWSAVRDVFNYGSTTSAALCRLFDLDPDELVPGNRAPLTGTGDCL